ELGLEGLEDDRIKSEKENNPAIIKSNKSKFRQENGKAFPKWEMKKLGEVCEKKSSNISANKIEENFGEYIIYGASGILKKVDFYEEENDYVSIIKDGAGVGRIVYCKGKSSVLGTMEIIKPKIELNTYFLYCILENVDFTKYITGSTIPHIYFKDYKNEICEIPSLPEQTKIANFLSSLDEKINHTETQIQQTQVWKKGLLQKMFV
ncbi:MAG: restriction endonuclease subunit S, partial [Pseudarcicella sp.]|nr:restriction endonuclease subunit S [Pseudarcicella sp.]